MRGAEKRRKREHNERAWLAWTIATLPYSKEKLRLSDLMFIDKPEKARTWEDEFAQWSAWAGAVQH